MTLLGKYSYAYILIALAILTFLTFEIINGRFWMNDFRVYYEAATTMSQGNFFYGTAYGLPSGFYKYSPVSVFFFLPYLLIPFDVAKFFHSVLIIISIYLICEYTIAILKKMKWVNRNDFPHGLLLLTSVIVMNHWLRELHLGNINIILLFLLLASLDLNLKNRQIASGILYALVLVFKPHFIILFLIFFLFFRFKTIVSSLISVCILLIFPFFVFGISDGKAAYSMWLESVLTHNNSLFLHPDTIYSWVYRLFPVTGILPAVIILIILFLFGIFFHGYNLKNKYASFSDRLFVFEYLSLVAIVPNLTLTDSQHFLFSFPIILLGLVLFKKQPFSLIATIMFSIGCLMYGFNWHDLVGHDFSVKLSEIGVLGIGNILILIATAAIFIHGKRKSIRIR